MDHFYSFLSDFVPILLVGASCLMRFVLGEELEQQEEI